jgi:hypothetical protein
MANLGWDEIRLPRVVVCSFKCTLMVYERGDTPRPSVPRPAEDSLPAGRELTR